MTDCNHSQGICDNRWQTEGQPCCDACTHAGSSTERFCWCGTRLNDGEIRCPRCVGDTRFKLHRIGQLCLMVPTLAAEQGRAERGDITPAADLAGPVPELSTYLARRLHALNGALCRCADRGYECPDIPPVIGPVDAVLRCPDLLAWLNQADDVLHPLWVLGTWEMAVAEHLRHTRTDRVTIKAAVLYIDANLTDLARHEDFGFDEMANNIHDCLRHVETMLNVAPYTETGAPCPICDANGRPARALERHYGRRCRHEGHDHETEPQDDDCDLWVCPTRECGEEWTVEQYGKYVKDEAVQYADRLTAAQMEKVYRVKEGTLRRWANGWIDHAGQKIPACVRKRGKDASGRQLYDVSDALAARDKTARERVA